MVIFMQAYAAVGMCRPQTASHFSLLETLEKKERKKQIQRVNSVASQQLSLFYLLAKFRKGRREYRGAGR